MRMQVRAACEETERPYRVGVRRHRTPRQALPFRLLLPLRPRVRLGRPCASPANAPGKALAWAPGRLNGAPAALIGGGPGRRRPPLPPIIAHPRYRHLGEEVGGN
jgi:hypothetical protein